MKKTVSFALLCCLAALPAGAFSTCETRVDSHQDASTSERVAYCLTEEDVKAIQDKPALIYSGVSSKEPQEEEEIKPTKNKNPYFRADKKSVAREYVVSKQFPDFKNSTLSEQERAALAKQQALAEQAAEDYHITGEKPARVDPETSAKAVSFTETKSGLARRQTKPKRFMKETFYEEEAVDAQTETQTEEPLAQPYAPAEEPAAQIPDTQDIPYGVQDEQDLPFVAADPYLTPKEDMAATYGAD